jgi:serine/threonine protein kinase
MLSTGMRLGPYEITGPLGAGGMGEVYRARDTRLDRMVALKVLPGDVTHGPERRARFEREARAIAALSHPHICTLHDVGRHQDLDFLVMELIEGRTLAERLRGGALDLGEALAYAVQIADGLAAAHRQGIVHRDLKPGNIMLARSGTATSGRPHAKLLDFGLARLRVEPAVAEAATATSPLTGEGAIIGTLQYMAPEQLEGKGHDARVDVFAFGAILFEMITGRRAFDGNSAASVAGAVLHKTPPPITVTMPAAPPALERLIATCLAKDPDDRWSSMHDVLLQLRAITLEEPAEPAAPATRRPAPPRSAYLAWGLAAMLALVAAAAWIVPRSEPPTRPQGRPDLMSILPPPGATPSYAWEAPQVSPDGRYVAFAASDTSGTVWLYVRSRDTLEPRRLPGTEEANLPFWSPDSSRLGFFAAGQLKTVAIAGGAARALAPAPVARGGDWGKDDVILYTALPNNPPMLVPATGGEPRPVPLERAERGFRSFPRLLPDGRHYLYQALDSLTGGPQGLHVASLDSTDVREIVKTRSNGMYVNGRLLFLQDTALVAQPFDAATLQLQGTPVTLVEGVGFNAITYQGLYSVSGDVLAYLGATRGAQLAWFDRQGRSVGTLTPPGDYSTLCLTENERGVVFEQADPATGTVDLWHIDLASRQATRLTFDPTVDFYPICGPSSASGQMVVFSSLRSGPPSLFGLSTGAPGRETPILVSFAAKIPSDWATGGRTIVFSVLNAKTNWDIASVPAEGGEPRMIVETPADERGARISPDGRWLAYTAREGGGRFEIYVQPYPSGGAKWQVSRGGGMQPMWRKDGRELYYVSPERSLMAVPVKAGGADFAFDEGRPLMAARTAGWEGGNSMGAQYAATSDGQRFLISTAAEIPPITVMLNWAAALTR